MDYTLAQVDALEKRIKAECPGARTSRANYGWCLAAQRVDKSETFIVFETAVHPDDTRPTIIGDVGAIIAALNEKREPT